MGRRGGGPGLLRRSLEFAAAHPVVQAAWAHYAFVAVHPFADGNGRVARALASVFLYRRPGVPLVIFADQKDAYLDGLEEADQGRPDRFVRFVQERVADVVGLVQVSAQTTGTSVAQSIASLRSAMVGEHGLPHVEIDALALRLLRAAHGDLVKQLTELDLPAGVSVHDSVSGRGIGSDDEYRPLPGFTAIGAALVASVAGTEARAEAAMAVRVRVENTGTDLFELSDLANGRRLTVDLREVYPTFSAVLELKLQLWNQGTVEQMLTSLDDDTRSVLRRSGYL